MTADVVIRAEGLGKKYLIGHQIERHRYTALRDVITYNARSLARTATDMLRGRPMVVGDSAEEFWALKGVNFEVRRGEVLGIIGRNGAGKSTLLKILSRITDPSTGRVRIRGRVASLLEVGTGFHPELTGRENIYLNGAILGMTRAEVRRKFDEIVAFAEVEKFIDTPVKRYSSGMYVRLAFAVAAHLEPEILVVDEVLAVGDAQFQKRCLGKMGDVARKKGRTILFVSHNMDAVQQLCGRAILLNAGTLLDEGLPTKVISSYLSDVDAGKVSLRDWSDRVTNNHARIVNFEVCNERGVHIASVLMGNKLRFVLTVELYRPAVGIQFGILVHSALGEAILELRSSHDDLYFDGSTGTVTIEAVMEKVGLYPGEYTLSPWICDRSYMIDIDWVRHCCKVNVLSVPDGGLGLDPKLGKYYVPSLWSIRSSASKSDLSRDRAQTKPLRNV